MRSYDEYLKELPTHIADQADAAEKESWQMMRDTVLIMNLIGEKRTPGDEDQARRAVELIMRYTNQPRLCRHLYESINQTAWWFIGVDREEIKCKNCLTDTMNDPMAVAKALADKRCELCLKPTTVFHADSVRFGIGFPDGAVAVTAIYEACVDCHAFSFDSDS